jgi:hypothetical protein
MQAPAELAWLTAVAIVAIAAIVIILLSGRKTPQERERVRRLFVNRTGRMGDALITGASDEILYYSYSVRGVGYAASQDCSGLKDLIPDDPESLIGPATLKYVPTNPLNSIVICEEWSGFRKQNKQHIRLFQKGA